MHNLREGPWEFPKSQDLPETLKFCFVYFLSLERLLGCFSSEDTAVQYPVLGVFTIELSNPSSNFVSGLSSALKYTFIDLYGFSPLNISADHFNELSY